MATKPNATGGPGGRPRGSGRNGVARPTTLVRVRADLAAMLGLVARYEGVSVAHLVDPLLRGPVLERFAALPDHVRALAE